jgi:hypothetical protein
MATYTDSLGFNKGTAAYDANGVDSVTKMEVVLDFAAITAARLAAGATALTAGDVIEAMPLPAKASVLAVGLDVTTAEGATLTVDVGDGTDPDGYLDGVDGNAVASYATLDGATGYATGRYYGSADTLDVTIVNAADTAVMRLWAVVADCG